MQPSGYVGCAAYDGTLSCVYVLPSLAVELTLNSFDILTQQHIVDRGPWCGVKYGFSKAVRLDVQHPMARSRLEQLDAHMHSCCVLQEPRSVSNAQEP